MQLSGKLAQDGLDFVDVVLLSDIRNSPVRLLIKELKYLQGGAKCGGEDPDREKNPTE